jgi:hypothetical protein
MAAEEMARSYEIAADEFLSSLMQDSAPASYMPLLVQLLQGMNVPTYVKVGHAHRTTTLLATSSQTSP